MTPAIQKNDIRVQSEADACEQSLNITQIFKKMKPFPEKMSRPRLTVAIDLGQDSWHVSFMSSRKTGRRTFSGMDRHMQLLETIFQEMRRLGIGDTRDVVICHEIGRDGLWARDWFVWHGFPCVVLSSDVLSGNGRAVKTDRVDAGRLAVRLCRFHDGELECDHVHMPPSREVLDRRALTRWRSKCVELRTGIGNSFKSMLALHMPVRPGLKIRDVKVDELLDSHERPLPEISRRILKRQQELWLELDGDVAAADSSLKALCGAARKAHGKGEPQSRTDAMVAELMRFGGIGPRTAWVLVHELYHKEFRNTGQVGSATGLVAVPRSSGSSDRCAGISRRSNNRLRATLVELAWRWVRLQPDSVLTRWFLERTAPGVSTRRMRKVAIVAVARKLAVALWKHLEHGEVPEGAKVTA